MSRRRAKKGRSEGLLTSFVAIERYILNCSAWRHLSTTARSAYIEFGNAHDGRNNGRIIMSARVLGERLNMNKSTAARAIQELIEKGFIAVMKESHFNMKQSNAAEYRLTCRKCNVTSAIPTKEFMRWSPEKQNTVACVNPTVTSMQP